MNPTTYIYFAHNKRKVPLYNSDQYTVELGNGTSLNVPPHYERLFVQYLNFSQTPDNPVKAKRYIHHFLNITYKDFPYHLQDNFIDKFIKDHPAEIVQNDETPLHAVDGLYSFYATTANQVITITDTQEKELAGIIIQNKTNPKKHVAAWFVQYYYENGENPLTNYEDVQNIAAEFINNKGYIVPVSNTEEAVTRTTTIMKFILYLIGGIILICLFISMLSFLFS